VKSLTTVDFSVTAVVISVTAIDFSLCAAQSAPTKARAYGKSKNFPSKKQGELGCPNEPTGQPVGSIV
jgi:hypothetical protein